jgi:GNAT superfamily N-acetyltransferase
MSKMFILFSKFIEDEMVLRVKKGVISTQDYQKLRATTGWDMFHDKVVERSLSADLFSVSIYDGEDIIGCGRVIGDGLMYFYIQDIIVSPEYQKKGIGTKIMLEIEKFLKKRTVNNSFIGLMAARGVREFYRKFGYSERSPERPGMCKIVKK